MGVRPSGCSVIGTSPIRPLARARLDDHFRSRTPSPCTAARDAPEALVKPRIPQWTSWIGSAEPAARQGREHRVPPHPVEPTASRPADHRPPPARQPAALHQVGSVAQLLDEARDFAEVVAVVGVAHHDKRPRAAAIPPMQRVPVTSLGDGNHARARALGDRAGVVGAAVVGDDDLPRNAGARQGFPGPGDAVRERVGFVETGDDHRHFRRRRLHGCIMREARFHGLRIPSVNRALARAGDPDARKGSSS